jgi:hypothetical protein
MDLKETGWEGVNVDASDSEQEPNVKMNPRPPQKAEILLSSGVTISLSRRTAPWSYSPSTSISAKFLSSDYLCRDLLLLSW